MLKDSVDEKVNPILLKCKLHGDHDEAREYVKVFALCPLDRGRVRAHISRANAMVELLHVTIFGRLRSGIK